MKETKKMNYAIAPIRKILLSEAGSIGGTEKKAEALEGTWIRLNGHMFAFEETDKVTLVHREEGVVGCACDRFKDSENLMCEHILAFEALKTPPQMSIKSPDCQWLLGYLMSACDWVSREGYLYPPKTETPETETEEKQKLDPVNEDKPIGTGVDDAEDEEPKIYERKCMHCGFLSKGYDIEKVKQRIEDHRKTCPKNPANKATDAKTATVEPEKKVKQSTAVTKPEPTKRAVVEKEMPTEAQFQTAAVGRILKNQGSIYKVGGKEVADSAAVSNYAVSAGVSTETTVLEQTTEYARATVRAHKGGRYTEGSVLIRKDAIFEKIVIDLAEKNPGWIIGWSNGLPEFDLDMIIHVGEKRKILGLHIAGTLIDKWTFASRDCETKAGRRAMIKILGADWREDAERASEVEEMETVGKKR